MLNVLKSVRRILCVDQKSSIMYNIIDLSQVILSVTDIKVINW